MDLKVLAEEATDRIADFDDLGGRIENRQAELAASADNGEIAQTEPLHNQHQTPTDSPKSNKRIIAAAPEGMPDEAIHENAPSKGNVYYDVTAQNFFSEFIRWIEENGNHIRKASKITPVFDKLGASHDPKAISLINNRNQHIQMSISGSGLIPESKKYTPDVYKKLNNSLISMRSAAERSADQLLKSGNCEDEIKEIQKHLHEVREIALKEIERRDKEKKRLESETR
ncbi:unnamed protein product [Clonostachys rhizophaga]|uniref:Uncharacterized protein n=1 Tax=Clonostachys rhizophaga TaxID=160324 RepID=A0A9N9YH35_9HYPO|nr:unnamed protein product [Clonostachys rhizophaga]